MKENTSLRNDIKIQGFKEVLICVRYTMCIYYSVDGHQILTIRS